MNAAGHHLLPGSEFSLEEHRRVLVGDLFDDFLDLADLGARPDHLPAGLDDAVFAVFLHSGNRFGATRLQGQFDGFLEIDQLERFRQVVEGPETHRLHRGLDRSVAGDHDDLGVRMVLVAVTDDVETVHVAEAEIHDHEVGFLEIQCRNAFAAAEGFGDPVSLHPARFSHQVQDGRFIIDHKNLGHGSELGDEWDKTDSKPESLSLVNTTDLLIIATGKSQNCKKPSQICPGRREAPKRESPGLRIAGNEVKIPSTFFLRF